jgi:hypothetical protein
MTSSSRTHQGLYPTASKPIYSKVGVAHPRPCGCTILPYAFSETQTIRRRRLLFRWTVREKGSLQLNGWNSTEQRFVTTDLIEARLDSSDANSWSGCRMCVQRRVKVIVIHFWIYARELTGVQCDQTRPFCNRCIKGNRECPGYEPSIKFQDEGPKLRELYRHDTLDQLSGQTSANASSEDPQFEYTTEVPLTLRLTQATKSGSFFPP